MIDAEQKIRNNSSRKRKRFAGFPQCLAKYKDHFSFLRDAKFLEDLENDSVDSDIIDEELSALQQEPISKRERVVKFLQSNPVQILLCVIVLLDAGIVIAQILLDLNSVKEKLIRRDIQLSELVAYIRDANLDQLDGYTGTNVDLILQILRRSRDNSSLDAAVPPPTGNSSSPGSSPESLNDTLAETLSAVPIGAGGGGGVAAHSPLLRREVVSGGGSPVVGNMSDAGTTGVSFDADRQGHYVDTSGNYDTMHTVAHWLHFASISLLGFLVVEDLIKMIAMGWTFCKHKIEIFDAIIISSSFTIDLVFLNGVSGEEGQKAAAILVVLLLWRIARVVDGIVVTVKQRQEFRIRLQKRARRLAERKVETYEEERHTRSKQIEALKDLCSKAGITDADIAACAPRQHGHVKTTLDALSSVAKLSVSMTMLMSSGIYHHHHHKAAPLSASTGAADGSASLIDDTAFDAKSSDSHSFSITQRCLPLRIESLPNIQHGTPAANERRKAFSSKIRRKRASGGVAGQIASDRRRSVQGSVASTCSMGASTDPPTTVSLPLTTPPRASSPINSCGIRIVIDGSEETENAMAAYSNSGLTFGEMDDEDGAGSTSQMFLLSDMV